MIVINPILVAMTIMIIIMIIVIKIIINNELRGINFLTCSDKGWEETWDRHLPGSSDVEPEQTWTKHVNWSEVCEKKGILVIKNLRDKIIMMLIRTDWNFKIFQKELPLFYLNLYYIIFLGIWIGTGIGIWI